MDTPIGEYDHFTGDFSAEGTISVEVQRRLTKNEKTRAKHRLRKKDPVPQYKIVNVSIPLWYGMRLKNNKLEKDETQKFVCCRVNTTLDVFIKEDEFRKRLSVDKKTYKAAYKADWKTQYGDGLSCKAWVDDGGLVGIGNSEHWPTRGLKAEDDYDAQRRIWWLIALKKVNVGSGRLWRPVKPLSKKLTLTFAPVDASTTSSDVKSALGPIMKKEQKRFEQKKSSMLDWMTPVVVEKDSTDLIGKALLSQNLLKFYETYISLEDLQVLIKAQTDDRETWARDWPSPDQAKDFNKDMLDNLVADAKWKKNINDGVVANTSTAIAPNKNFGSRIDAQTIMGKQSANQWGEKLWYSGAGSDWKMSIAEWLHRSAYSFGGMLRCNFQSPQNIMFGTYEANSDMTRAETVIRLLRNAHDKVEGELLTAAVNVGTTTIVDYKDGRERAWGIEAWIGERNYSWLVPELQYSGSITINRGVNYARWDTQFHTFSRYSPLNIEGSLDRALTKSYIDENAANYDDRDPAEVKKPKRTPLNSLLAASNTNAPLASPKDPFAVGNSLSNWISSSAQISQGGGTYPAVNLFSGLPNSGNLSIPAANNSTPPGFVSKFPGPTHPFLLAAAPLQLAPTGKRQSSTLQALNLNPRHVLAWNAITKGQEHVHLGDLKLRNPTQVREDMSLPPPNSLPATPPPEGFILSGNLDLFGLKDYDVSVWSWHGPTPASVVIGSDVPVYQQVKVDTILRPASFIPLLEGTPLGDFELRNVLITYQNYNFEATKPKGWSLVADILIDAKHGALYSILNACGIKTLDVKVMASLGTGHSWMQKPDISDFSIRGIIELPHDQTPTKKDDKSVFPGVKFTRIGIDIFGAGTTTRGVAPKRSMKYGFGIFGELDIELPGSVTPAVFDFSISEFGGMASLGASIKGDLWENAFGTGIDLESVTLSAVFAMDKPIESLDFALTANLRTDTWSARFEGHYASKTNYQISARIEDMGCDGLLDLFHHFSGDSVSLPEHCDVTIGSALIVFDHANGLTITVDHLAFDNYSSADAMIHLSSNGVVIHGNVSNIEFPEIDLQIVSAFINVSLVKAGSSKSSDVALGGIVKVKGLDDFPEISAGVHLYKASGDSKALDWTIYGSFTALGNTTTLGKLLPAFQNTFMKNLALQNLAFVAASRDDPALSALNPHQFPIKQGIQLAAILGEVDPFTKLLRTKSFPGLTLCARWSNSSFALHVVLPTDTMIHLGRGITTDPIDLSIQSDPVNLQISTGVSVPVAGSKDPLDFKASLSIVEDDVSLTGGMDGLWTNPLGISRNVTIGPHLALQLQINLLLFPATGLPTSFGFAGGIAVGSTGGKAAVQISEDPTQELLFWELNQLSIADLTNFVGEVIATDIPTPPNFLEFQKVSLYVSSGVTIGSISYPAGFSFFADLQIFGVTLRTSAAIVNRTLVAAGSIQNLSVGPLAIEGQHGRDATVSLSLGSSQQSVSIDGSIALLGSSVGLTVQLQVLPTPSFFFQFQLHFTDLLDFTVDAQMIGDHVDLNNLTDLDFSLHALFEQHLVEYIRDQVISSLEALKKGINQHLDDAKKKVEEEKVKWQADISAAQAKLDHDYQSWTQHSNEIHASSQKIIDDYMARLHELQADVDRERLAFNQRMKDFEGGLQHANAVRADKMRDAQAAVTNAKSKWDSDVAEKERELEAARQDLNSKFGHAKQDIEDAERKVDGLNSSINGTHSTINDYENAPWYEFWKKAAIPELYVALGALEASKAIANGALTVANEVVNGTQYATCKGAVPLLEKAVSEAGAFGDTLYNGALKALKEADELTSKLVSDAEGALEEFRKGGDAIWKKAESVMDDFVRAQQVVLSDAQKAVEGLVRSAEWLAYQAASGGLAMAQHATHGLDVATKALTAIEQGADGLINVTEKVVTAALSALNITKIELGGTFKALIGSDTKQHFVVSVVGEVAGHPFQFEDVPLSLKATDVFIHELFVRLVALLKTI